MTLQRVRTLAHLSDLHLGHALQHESTARRLCARLLADDVDQVVVTGDVTHRGKRSQLAMFERAFAPIIRRGRLTVIPGNHDRAGEDAGAGMMGAQRVSTRTLEGLHLVRVDSTAAHNRKLLASHGDLCARVMDAVDLALAAAPGDCLVALLLHHHVLPLPEESWMERLSTIMGWPYASELPLGLTLLERIQGRCDLVLHGHRHVPRAFQLGAGDRPLGVYNAGSSTELAAYRCFRHVGSRLQAPPEWVRLPPLPSVPRPVQDTGTPAHPPEGLWLAD